MFRASCFVLKVFAAGLQKDPPHFGRSSEATALSYTYECQGLRL